MSRPISAEQRLIIDRVLRYGRKVLSAARGEIPFETGSKHAEKLLNDLEGYPHCFVLASIMDQQIKAPRAWIIPYKIGKRAGGFKFAHFERLTRKEITAIFNELHLHRFNTKQAQYFYAAVRDIREKYQGDASQIWANKPQSGTVVRRFLEFKGVGVKIATMATNILVRDFKVPLADYSSIDISPDRRVMRFFKEHGLLRKGAKTDELIYLAREISPKFPGLLDIAAWTDGAAAALRGEN
jgi:endonuclease III